MPLIVHGKNKLKATYDDEGHLLSTHDKFDVDSGDFDRHVRTLKGDVRESNGDFTRFGEIPLQAPGVAPNEEPSEDDPGEDYVDDDSGDEQEV